MCEAKCRSQLFKISHNASGMKYICHSAGRWTNGSGAMADDKCVLQVEAHGIRGWLASFESLSLFYSVDAALLNRIHELGGKRFVTRSLSVSIILKGVGRGE